MKNLNIAVAQFQPKDGDKAYNLSVIRELTQKAKSKGADIISFHEMSITAYTYTKDLSLEQITDLAEEVPIGESTQELISISKEVGIPILAGLVEKSDGRIYNTYICVTRDGLVAKFRKLHPFISQHLSPGDQYCVFNLLGWKCGILICYDNNVIENVRATSLLGAELILHPTSQVVHHQQCRIGVMYRTSIGKIVKMTLFPCAWSLTVQRAGVG